MPDADVLIVGGGAAGLTAAIFAAEANAAARVVVVDGAKVLGAKILVSGGGRCNVTHRQVAAVDFNGSRNIVRNVLAAFDETATVRWFASMGVHLVHEPTGKLFPVANSAKSVVAGMLGRCAALGVQLRTGSRVTGITADAGTDAVFAVHTETGDLTSPAVVLATGGRSLPRSGSDGFGWELAKALGHTVTGTHAALVPLTLDPTPFHAELAGVTQEVELFVVIDGKRVDRRRGSLLWTHFGVSGPVVLDASRHWTTADAEGRRPTLLCNLLPGRTSEQAEAEWIACTAARPKATLLTHLAARVPERVAIALLRHAGLASDAVAGQLSREGRRTLVRTLTALVLPVAQPRGWNYAEVTAGGVPLNEIDYRTMQSRRRPGLFFAGEILDCDGRIGGFNFQWAWSTGYLAGRAAAAGRGVHASPQG